MLNLLREPPAGDSAAAVETQHPAARHALALDRLLRCPYKVCCAFHRPSPPHTSTTAVRTTRLLAALLPVALATLALSGCSPNDQALKSYLRCGMAASYLGEKRASTQITRAMRQFIADAHGPSGARTAALLGREVREDMTRFHKSLDMQALSFFKIYNSAFCQGIHNQGKADVPWKYYIAYPFI